MKIQRVTHSSIAFATNLRRARAFLGIFDTPGGSARTRGRPTDNEKELLRASVVFAVAALDAYLHDLVIERVVGGKGDPEALRDALRAIAKDDPSLSLRVALADSKAARREEFGRAIEIWLSTKSFQGPEAVIRSLGYVGLDGAAALLAAEVASDWAAQLRSWTEMRHGLVHRAESPYVKRSTAGECVDFVESLVAVIDRVVVE